MIPSFAVGRVEEVLYWLKRLEDDKRIPILPVYVDSPMAIGALQFYSARLEELDADIANPQLRGEHSGAQAAAAAATQARAGMRDTVSTTQAATPGMRRVAAF